MTNALLMCITCNNVFRRRSDLMYHVKRDHQSLIKVKFENGSVTEIKKGEDGMFKCKCGKRFKLSITLRKHAKGCGDELTELEEDEEERALMNVLEDSDASESINVDDRIISADCFGALISYEKC